MKIRNFPATFFRGLVILLLSFGTAFAMPGQTTRKVPLKPAAPATSKITNNDVVQMVIAGLSEQVIITAIRQAPNREFDLSPVGLVSLKKAKVSDSLILVMQNPDLSTKPATPFSDAAKPPPTTLSDSPSPELGFYFRQTKPADKPPFGDYILLSKNRRFQLVDVKDSQHYNGTYTINGSTISFVVATPNSTRFFLSNPPDENRLEPGAIIEPNGTVWKMRRPNTSVTKTSSKYDENMAEPPKPTTETSPPPSSPCADIDYLGVILVVAGGGEMAGVNAYGGRVRNRASYAKEVDFQWVMNGRTEFGTFRIPAGQFIQVNLGQGSAPPTGVRVVGCR